MSLTHRTLLRIPAQHPSLPGHFPGRPVVPGVLLLDRVIEAAERWLSRPLHVISLPQAKFKAALLPEQTADLQLQIEGTELRFTLSRDGEMIALGTLGLADREST